MRISLPALTAGTVTTLVITALLVFLRDVEIVEQVVIPLGMMLISLLFTFIAAPTYEAVRKSISYRVSPARFDPSFRIRVIDLTPLLPTMVLVFLLFAMSFLLGDGVVYGVDVGEPLLSQKIGGMIVMFALLIVSSLYVGGLLTSITIAEAFRKHERKLSNSIYFFDIFFVTGFALLIGKSPFFMTPFFARVGVGYLLLGISPSRLSTLRDFFTPLMGVLIPLTAYLSGARVG